MCHTEATQLNMHKNSGIKTRTKCPVTVIRTRPPITRDLITYLHFSFFTAQVDLHFLKVLTGIATQGAVSKETHKSYFVTTFKLEVSTNGEDWMIYRFGKNHKVR